MGYVCIGSSHYRVDSRGMFRVRYRRLGVSASVWSEWCDVKGLGAARACVSLLRELPWRKLPANVECEVVDVRNCLSVFVFALAPSVIVREVRKERC